MRWLFELLRALFRNRPRELVRPWAFSASILVLLITLPLLRPWRHPHSAGDDELAILATTQAIVEHKTLAIDRTSFFSTRRKIERPGARVGSRWYADQPPVQAYLLSIPYRVMYWNGLTFASDKQRVEYLLTLIGSAIPAMFAAGLVFRMSRLFQLKRPMRALLAASAVLGTGLISYATSLNAHAPAATFVLASATCLVHLAICTRKPIVPFWLISAGLFGALAAVVDPSAIPFLPLLLAVVPAYRWTWWRRIGGVMLFVLGAAAPIALHAVLAIPATGDPLQGMGFAAPPGWSPADESAFPDELDEPRTGWRAFGQTSISVLKALVGGHGLLSHFPILVFGAVGVGMVMHRHWPTAAKVLAAATVGGGLFLVIAYAVHRPPSASWRDAMFAARWFVVFGPLTLFWAGAWLRRKHARATWWAAAVVLVFSLSVGLAGAAAPWPRNGFERYSAAEAVARLWRGGANEGSRGQTVAGQSDATPVVRALPGED